MKERKRKERKGREWGGMMRKSKTEDRKDEGRRNGRRGMKRKHG